MKCRTLAESFSHAYEGIIYTIRNERNMRIHITAAVMVVIAGIAFRISSVEYSLVFLAIGLVFVSEILNTAIESVVNMMVKEYNAEAKIAKDVAAGASLVSAVIAVLIGINVFGWRVLQWIRKI